MDGDGNGNRWPEGWPCVGFDHHDVRLDATSTWEAYAELQRRCPVARSEAHGGFWVLTRYDDVMAAIRDHGTFSSADGHLLPTGGELRSIPLDFDPPVHPQYRELITRPLGPARVRAAEPLVREFLSARLDGAVARGGGDLAAELAVPLPLWVLTALVGLSEASTAELRSMTEAMWSQVATRPLAEARADLLALMARELDRHPGDSDYIGWLSHGARLGGRPLSRPEAQGLLNTLALAGHETTMDAVGNLLYQLAVAPGLQGRIRAEPGIIPAVVEESLRLRAPTQSFARTVTRDTVVRGVTLRAGDRVLLVYAAANRDPERFPQPERFDPDRFRSGSGAVQHLSFGWGIHHCPGAPLARMEMRVLLELLRERPPFAPDGEAVFSRLEGGHHMGMRRLPVAFGAAAV